MDETREHSVRNSLFDRERSFSLGSDALCWRDAAGEGQIAYADVSDMRLIGYLVRIGETLECTVRGHSGEKVKIRSAHYRSFANFEDRKASYAPFIAALAKRIAAQSPHAKFIAGSTVLWIYWLVLGVLSVILAGRSALMLFEGVPPGTGWMVVSMLCLLLLVPLPIAIWFVRRGWAHRFDPAAPPERFVA